MLVFDKNYLYTVLFFIALSLCLGCQSPSEKCSQDLRRINKLLLTEKDSSVLVNHISETIRKNVECLDLYLIRGDINLSAGNISAAYKDFSFVTKRDKENTYAMYSLGIIYNEQQKYDSAIAILQQAIDSKTHGSVVVDYNNKALMKEKVKYDVEYNELLYTQGMSFYYKRSLKEALNIFSYCISNNYRLGEAYLYKGAIILETRKDDPEACKDIQLAEMFGNKEASIYKKRFCQ